MDTLVERVAALDVHKDSVVACVRLPGKGRRRRQEKRTFRRCCDCSPRILDPRR